MQHHLDAEKIKGLGVTKLAKKLGMSPQRVQNWIYRGIPARVLLDHPKIFKR
jgi:hypothetical protein